MALAEELEYFADQIEVEYLQGAKLIRRAAAELRKMPAETMTPLDHCAMVLLADRVSKLKPRALPEYFAAAAKQAYAEARICMTERSAA